MADIAHYQTDLKLEEMEKRLSAIYSRTEAEIQKTAEEYFARFARQDEEKRKQVESGTITEEEYTRWRKNKVMYGARFTEMKEQCAYQLLNVNQTALGLSDTFHGNRWCVCREVLLPKNEGGEPYKVNAQLWRSADSGSV